MLSRFSSLMVLILLTFSESGYKAVMLTVDAPMLGRRLNEYRNSFGIPKGMGYPNLAPGSDMSNLTEPGEGLAYGELRMF